MTHDIEFVRNVMGRLAASGIETWLIGGWAEELHGLIAQRPHKDIDLLYPAGDFALVDAWLAREGPTPSRCSGTAPTEIKNHGARTRDRAALPDGVPVEIEAKRFPHKRAFELGGMMTELFLVLPDRTTPFWSTTPFAWPESTFADTVDGLRVASPEALAAFRAGHAVRNVDSPFRS